MSSTAKKLAYERTRKEEYEHDCERSHSSIQWGPFDVLIFYTAPHTYETYSWPDLQKLQKARAGPRWSARAYHGDRCRYRDRDHIHGSKKEALTSLRKQMRRELDRIPSRIDFLEDEYKRLREAVL